MTDEVVMGMRGIERPGSTEDVNVLLGHFSRSCNELKTSGIPRPWRVEIRGDLMVVLVEREPGFNAEEGRGGSNWHPLSASH